MDTIPIDLSQGTIYKANESLNKYDLLTDDQITVDGHTLFRIVATKDIISNRGSRHFSTINKGAKGGYVESMHNLSQDGGCWIFGNAKVYGDSVVRDDARVYDNVVVRTFSVVEGTSEIVGNATIQDSTVSGQLYICGHARIFLSSVEGRGTITGQVKVENSYICLADTRIGGDARIVVPSDYLIFRKWWNGGANPDTSSVCWCRSNDTWTDGSLPDTNRKPGYKYRYVYTTAEYIKAVMENEKDAFKSLEYMRMIDYVERVKKSIAAECGDKDDDEDDETGLII